MLLSHCEMQNDTCCGTTDKHYDENYLDHLEAALVTVVEFLKVFAEICFFIDSYFVVLDEEVQFAREGERLNEVPC